MLLFSHIGLEMCFGFKEFSTRAHCQAMMGRLKLSLYDTSQEKLFCSNSLMFLSIGRVSAQRKSNWFDAKATDF